MKPCSVGSDCAAAATPPSPEYDDEDEPCTKKHSRNGQVPQEEGVAMGSSIGVVSLRDMFLTRHLCTFD